MKGFVLFLNFVRITKFILKRLHDKALPQQAILEINIYSESFRYYFHIGQTI